MVKIIQFMSHRIPYEEYENKPRPKFHWNTPDGSWVGIWGYEWAEVIGKAMVDHYAHIEFEVWQIDTRADKIYQAQLQVRLIHRKFPGITKSHYPGLRGVEYFYSKELTGYLTAGNETKNVVFLMPATVENPLTREMILTLRLMKIPIIHYNFLNTSLLLPEIQITGNPVKLLHRYLISRVKKQHLRGINFLLNSVDNNPEAINLLKKKYPNIKHFDSIIGIELDYWIADISKQKARIELKLNNEDFIIFLSQRLVPEYQIDKLIGVISKIKTQKKFLFIISGHGTREYETKLKKLCTDFEVEELIRFIGFVTDEELKMHYTACDVFATVPIMFAGSNSAVKAMAMERPVIHVTMGVTYEFLKKNNAGIFVSPSDYDQWAKVFTEVIEGKEIKIVPRDKVVDYFSWKSTARLLLHAIEKVKK